MPKFAYLRSESYRQFVASHACFGCGIEGWSQAAHPNGAKYGKGKSIKAGDQFCFPLCSTRPGHIGCHVMRPKPMGRAERNRRWRAMNKQRTTQLQLMHALAANASEFGEAA